MRRGTEALTVKLIVLPETPIWGAMDSFAPTGGTVTVMLKVFSARFPAVSLAVVTTVVVPIEKIDPALGILKVETNPLTMSTADVLNGTDAPAREVALTVIDDGVVIVGGVVSTTFTVRIAVSVTPSPSVAAHLTL